MLCFFADNSISPEHSVIAFDQDKPIGFVFVAIKEVDGHLLAWNGGTGIIPEYRGKGLAKLLLGKVRAILLKANVHKAWLEVVASNKPALAAYQSIGFEKVDDLIGMTVKEDWNPHAWATSGADEYLQVSKMTTEQISLLPFYKEDSAWRGQWHVLKRIGGQGACVRDEHNAVTGYALYYHQTDRSGLVNSASLFQLELAPNCGNKEAAIKKLLTAVFLPESKNCVRSVRDLTCAEPITLEWLEAAGFKEAYRQYLLALNLAR